MSHKPCSTCAAFAALKNECRAKSPTAVLIEGPRGHVSAGIYPAVTPDGWCCEWRPEEPQIVI